MIGFNVPIYIKESIDCIKEAAESRKICGDGAFTKKCSEWMENKFNAHKVLMTTSCTSALEMAAILLDLKPGDEVIMPSYTFVSTADAFVMVGAKVVFVDVNPDTMNIDEEKIKEAITDKTKAIAVVHYAGISPDMDKVMKIAKEHNLKVVEDAAQGFMAKYKDKYLGTIGDIGCYSFHETKNYSMGEGGAVVINDPDLIERAEIIREKGTNRNKFFRGEIDKYTWVDYGSSYLPSELNCAYLYPQLDKAEEMIQKPSFRENKGLGNEVGYYIFDYPAEKELYIRERIEYIKKKSENSDDDFKVVVFDLYDIMIDILIKKGYLEKCYQFEKTKGFERVSKSISNMLRITSSDSLIVNHIRDNTPEKAVVFITGIGKCYPILRSHTVLNNLHQVIDNVPVVLFYPGNYDGQELVLFGEIKDDNYYRAFKLVD